MFSCSHGDYSRVSAKFVSRGTRSQKECCQLFTFIKMLKLFILPLHAKHKWCSPAQHKDLYPWVRMTPQEHGSRQDWQWWHQEWQGLPKLATVKVTAIQCKWQRENNHPFFIYLTTCAPNRTAVTWNIGTLKKNAPSEKNASSNKENGIMHWW